MGNPKVEDAGSGNTDTVAEESEKVAEGDNSRKMKNKIVDDGSEDESGKLGKSKISKIIGLGNGSEVVYYPTFLNYEEAWTLFHYLNNHIPWTRPTLRVFGRSCVQPRDSCYIAGEGVRKLSYSGYEPVAHSWQLFPPLNDLLCKVEAAVPGSRYNSLLLNRYNGGNDYVGWHSDNEPLYGPTPQIASLSLGCDRHFFLKKKTPPKSSSSSVLSKNSSDKPASKRLKKTDNATNQDQDQHSLLLKHGSLLIMRGYTQRDWIHSVPKRTKIDAVRINLTFRWRP